MITQLGSNIYAGIRNRVKIKFKGLINIVEHERSIVINDEDVVEIAQDLGLLCITVTVIFGLDPHVQVGWEGFLP